ncbi:ABC transporter permease [Gemmatimonas sp.]|uniref:ABC transporter permease n=1 Tax=Gemmatimonas sp. TaxID=1962908 RepID=UPI0025C519AB|nr:ABC transporter permease [Gemmatimonas sp.]MCA2991585.1 ABC transporter permease [Gemmatimonas sp.]
MRLGARLLQGAMATFAAATFAFVCLQLAPGDPLTALGEGVPVAVRAELREIYGYDAPLGVQYLRWLAALVQGDLGWSTLQQRPARDVVLDALPNSLMLVGPGLLLALLAASVVGVWQGIHAQRPLDRVLTIVVFVLYGLPEFTVALFLLLLFSVIWPVLPSGGLVSDLHAYLPAGERLLDRLRHLILPTFVVALIDAATLTRIQRQSMRDVLHEPFVRTAFAAGLSRRRVYRQAWRASVPPVLTVFGILVPINLLGVVFVEQVFSWPGLGLTLLNAINARDYHVVAGCVLVQGLVIALTTTAVDLLRGVADPRVATAARPPAADVRPGAATS